MNLRLIVTSLFAAMILCCVATYPALAQGEPVTLVPDALIMRRTVPGDSVAGSLRLSVHQPISDVVLLVSDLQGVDSRGQWLDPIPASNITVEPALQFESLAANSLRQLSVRLAPPTTAGIYSGTLLIRWQQPSVGEVTVPISLQLRTKPELVVHDPADASGLAIYAVKGSFTQRNLVLREKSGGAIIHDLRALPQDLLDNVNHQMLSSNNLQINLAGSQVNPGDLLTTSLRINLIDVAAGDYKGNLTLVAAPDVLLTLPIEIQVRHQWYLALLVVGAGVLLGLGLSTYQARGRVRDEYVVRIAAVRDALKEDPDLQQGFGKRIESMLIGADADVRTAKWDTAESAVAEAENLLLKWRKQAQDWKAQLNYLRTQLLTRIQKRLEVYDDHGRAPAAIRRLERNGEDLLEGAADCASPTELRNKVADVEETFTLFERVERSLQSLSDLRDLLDPKQVDPKVYSKWRDEESRLEERLNTVPAEPEKINEVAGEIAAQAQVLRQYMEDNPTHLKQQSSRAAMATPALEAAGTAGVFLPGLSTADAYNPDKARERLRQHSWLLYILSALALVALGMSTLYVPNTTFGANTLSDYFALFVFGLGGQTTLASVTDLLQKWGLPWGK